MTPTEWAMLISGIAIGLSVAALILNLVIQLTILPGYFAKGAGTPKSRAEKRKVLDTKVRH